MAWRLSGSGRTVLRAGGGLYYDSSMSIATDVLNGGPLSIQQFASGATAPFSDTLTYGFMPNLTLPRVTQWNVALEHAFGVDDIVSLGYVGSEGHDLIRREVGGPAESLRFLTALTNDNARANYHSLQAQFRRRLAKALEAQASYTWSHSIDNDSSDSFLSWVGPGAGASNDRSSSDFDLRHAVTGSVSYSLPRAFPGKWYSRTLGGWSASGIVRARSGFPITVQQAESYNGISLINAFRPDWVWGQPLWVSDSSAPGGKRINPAAFSSPVAAVGQFFPQQGTLGRNVMAGFGMWQVDAAISREFHAGDRAIVQFRLEAFNVFNEANLADPVKFLDSPLFGQSSSMLNSMLGTGSPGSGLSPILQTGGPRELQLSLRLHF
jgi:hypothetical protein